MAWVDTTYMNNLLGSTSVTAITGGSSTVFDQFEAGAEATVRSALIACGYPDVGATLTAGTVTTAFLQKLCAGIWVRDAYANRKGVQLPPVAMDAIDIINKMFRAGADPKAIVPPIPGLDRNTRDGVGGVSFPTYSNDSTSDSARPMRFDRASLRSF